MRTINRVIIHCAATPPQLDIGAETIRRWHLERGWSDIGYHYVIRRNGAVEPGRAVEKIGAHVRGHNADSIGVCLVGGVDVKGDPDANFTPEQWASLRALAVGLSHAFSASVHGHNEFAAKACPSFDVAAWWSAVRGISHVG